ncbi:MAG: MmpS family transport accessory protein [Candidatus Paceibacterota bacterium]
MEPTTTNKSKTKMAIIIIIIVIIIIGAFMLSRSKSIAPSNTIGGNTDTTSTVTSGTDSKQLTDEITSATTFDNEAILKEIDTAF